MGFKTLNPADYAPTTASPQQRKLNVDISGTQVNTNRTAALTPFQVRAAKRKEDAATKAEKDAQDAAVRSVSSFRNDAEVALDAVNKLRNLLGPTSAGYGAMLQDLPESKAKEVAALIKQMQSNKFFLQVKEMKEGPGKSVGFRILQSEVPMFVNKWGTLDQARDTRGLAESLGVLDNQIRTMYARVSGADIDNPDPQVAYQVQQAYGIKPPGTALEQQVAPTLYKENPTLKPMAAGASEKSQAIPEPMQREYEEYVAPRIGNLDPEEYAKTRLQLDAKYGYGTKDDQADVYRAEAKRLNDAAARRSSINLQIPPANALANAEEKARAEALGSPFVGRAKTFGVSAVNAFTDDLFPSAVAALSGKSDEEVRRTAGAYEEAHPGTAFAGRLAGGVAQAALTPGLTAKYGLPMMGLHGGISGAATHPEDRLSGAAQGAAWGLGTGAAFKGLNAVAGGLGAKVSPLALKYGIPTTVGELTQSPSGRWLEQKLAGIPVVGTGVRNRMEEGQYGFNGAAFDDALKDIGGTTTSIGQPGVAEAYAHVGDAYDAALRGVRVPVNRAFRKALNNAIEGAGEVDVKYADMLDKELSPLLRKKTLNGSDVQQILVRARNVSAVAKDDNGAAWKNYVLPHIKNIESETTNAVGAVAPDAAADLSAANSAYRKVGILADAVTDHLDEGGVFTPQTLLKRASDNVEAFEGTPTLARGNVPGRKELPLLDLSQKAADKKTGLLSLPTGTSVATPAVLAGLGLAEAGTESAVSPTDTKTGQHETGFGSTAIRNAAMLAALAAGPRLAYSGPMQRGLQNALMRTPGPLPSLLMKYGPQGLAAAMSPATTYRPPIDVSERNMPVAQLPRAPSNYKALPHDISIAPPAAGGGTVTLPDGTEVDLSEYTKEGQ